MANYQIIEELNKSAHPDGIINLRWMLKANGSRDYKNCQLCSNDGNYQTPWLLEKLRCLAEYDNKIYCQVDKALEPIAHTIASKCKELELLKKPYLVPGNMDLENKQRLQAKLAEDEKRQEEIMIELAEIMMDIDTINAALQHHLQRAENVIMKHVSSYWSGILKADASCKLPPEPDFRIPDIPGKVIYDKHFTGIRTRLEDVLSDKEYTEEV